MKNITKQLIFCFSIIKKQVPPSLPPKTQFFEQLCLNGAEAKIPCDPSVQIFCTNKVKDGNQF